MITLDKVGKAYQSRQGTTHAVGEVSLTIEQGEFVSIVGPSGCGKSTLLNMIAGFLRPTTGAIRVDGRAGRILSVRKPLFNALPPHSFQCSSNE